MLRALPICLLLIALPATADYATHARAPALYALLETEFGFNAGQIERVRAALAGIERPAPVIEKEQQAAEKTRTWDDYRPIHVHEANIRNGRALLTSHARWLVRAEAEYGVPPEIIAAILGVETKYGSYTGVHGALEALATQGFDHPTRAEYFFRELAEYFVLCEEQRYVPAQLKGSYAGALGAAQFMPSNYRRLAIDFDGDGKRNLWELPDAIGSIAHYLVHYDARRRWQRGLPLTVSARLDVAPGGDWPLNPKQVTHRVRDFVRAGAHPSIPLPAAQPVALLALERAGGPDYHFGLQNFFAVMSYNPRVYYAMAVADLAREIREAPDPDRVARSR